MPKTCAHTADIQLKMCNELTLVQRTHAWTTNMPVTLCQRTLVRMLDEQAVSYECIKLNWTAIIWTLNTVQKPNPIHNEEPNIINNNMTQLMQWLLEPHKTHFKTVHTKIFTNIHVIMALGRNERQSTWNNKLRARRVWYTLQTTQLWWYLQYNHVSRGRRAKHCI